MKKYIILFLLYCISSKGFSQYAVPTVHITKNERLIQQTLSHYPGGNDAYIKYLKANMHYPEKEKAMGIDAIVQVSFVVDANGNITNTEIADSATESFNKEALRLIKSMPKWQPSIQNGKNVPATYIFSRFYFQWD